MAKEIPLMLSLGGGLTLHSAVFFQMLRSVQEHEDGTATLTLVDRTEVPLSKEQAGKFLEATGISQKKGK